MNESVLFHISFDFMTSRRQSFYLTVILYRLICVFMLKNIANKIMVVHSIATNSPLSVLELELMGQGSWRGHIFYHRLQIRVADNKIMRKGRTLGFILEKALIVHFLTVFFHVLMVNKSMNLWKRRGEAGKSLQKVE